MWHQVFQSETQTFERSIDGERCVQEEHEIIMKNSIKSVISCYMFQCQLLISFNNNKCLIYIVAFQSLTTLYNCESP